MEKYGSSITSMTTTEQSGKNIWTQVRYMESRGVRMAANINMCERLIERQTGTNEVENLAIKISINILSQEQRDGTVPIRENQCLRDKVEVIKMMKAKVIAIRKGDIKEKQHLK